MKNTIHNCANCKFKSFCLQKLNPTEIELVSAKHVELEYRKGEHIAKQGSFVHHVLFLQKGLVKIYQELNNNKDLILNIFSGGQLIGLSNLFTSNPLQYSIATIDDSTICAIDIRVIEELISSNGLFAKSIIKELNHCTHYYFQRIRTSSRKQLSGRMADALIYLADNVYNNDNFPLQLNRKELAEFADMSTMSAVRIIKELKISRIIEENNGKINIKNKKKLILLSKIG